MSLGPMMFGRRRKRLADTELYIGPATQRVYEIRKQLRAASTALDKGRCIDASMHLYEARDMMRGRDVGSDTRMWLADEKQRLKTECRVNLGARKRRRPR
jgi:hypothetical protein